MPDRQRTEFEQSSQEYLGQEQDHQFNELTIRPRYPLGNCADTFANQMRRRLYDDVYSSSSDSEGMQENNMNDTVNQKNQKKKKKN